jgi:hypothetical protein
MPQICKTSHRLFQKDCAQFHPYPPVHFNILSTKTLKKRCKFHFITKSPIYLPPFYGGGDIIPGLPAPVRLPPVCLSPFFGGKGKIPGVGGHNSPGYLPPFACPRCACPRSPATGCWWLGMGEGGGNINPRFLVSGLWFPFFLPPVLQPSSYEGPAPVLPSSGLWSLHCKYRTNSLNILTLEQLFYIIKSWIP